jgi:hypothetical protein
MFHVPHGFSGGEAISFMGETLSAFFRSYFSGSGGSGALTVSGAHGA